MLAGLLQQADRQVVAVAALGHLQRLGAAGGTDDRVVGRALALNQSLAAPLAARAPSSVSDNCHTIESD
ncbi:MAG: hypothetical protein OXE40_17610 [Gammaproteobacteria bacterium]|nr:hypothetical protein [Gammaproteobacteria bacterium]